jgi:NAD(P)-dependent dehydrogenase (short-subunit alcohol dehydrogenase family)
MLLKNKRIVLTGAGRGIGKIIAETCAKEGATMILIARTEAELQSTLKLVKKYNEKSFYICADISDFSNLDNVYNKIIGDIHVVDVLINNAGIQGPIGPFYLNKIEDWIEDININLLGTAAFTQKLLQDMIKNTKGKVINLSGGGATGSRPNFSAYAVAKTGIARFSEILADELRIFNIDVNAISPGAINTGMLDEVINLKPFAGKEFHEALKRKEIGGSDPNIAANLVVFLSSDLSDGISGKLISAIWDPWQDQQFQERLRNEKDLCTLRRIDEMYFKKMD